ncbi:hypothetical protein CDAR_314781 [Caerostris darwini]|uniref:Uncharacterized protein n=1 Tax=Caerostris darwini TaxID=1538125 RepID=A0AAV4TTX6_9ARAC|nr:hypothetical protein CDAR_314781 [Caerostris darwini]
MNEKYWTFFIMRDKLQLRKLRGATTMVTRAICLHCAVLCIESNSQHIGLRSHGYVNHSPSGPVIESSCAFCTPSTTVPSNRWGPGNITIVP